MKARYEVEVELHETEGVGDIEAGRVEIERLIETSSSPTVFEHQGHLVVWAHERGSDQANDQIERAKTLLDGLQDCDVADDDTSFLELLDALATVGLQLVPGTDATAAYQTACVASAGEPG